MDADERLTDWGASRRTYYGGDTADLEIGQKDDDAVEEEALARVQQREALDALDEDDFALDGDDDDDADEAESGDLFAALGRKGGARKAVDRKAITQRALEVLEAPVEARQLRGLGGLGGRDLGRVLGGLAGRGGLGANALAGDHRAVARTWAAGSGQGRRPGALHPGSARGTCLMG